MRMQRDVPCIVKGISVSFFVVVCDLPPRCIGKVPHEDVKVSKAESKDLESDFERLVRKLYGSSPLSGLPWSFWMMNFWVMSFWVIARHIPLRAARGLRSANDPLLSAIHAPKFMRRNS